MAKPSRTRGSRVPTLSIPIIQAGSCRLDLDAYAERLETLQAHTLGRVIGSSTHRLAKSLACARLVAAKTRNGPFEPTEYCNQTRTCVRCYYLLARARAQDLVQKMELGEDASRAKKVFGLVFTLPAPKTYEESLRFGNLAVSSLPKITQWIGHWNNVRAKKRAAEKIYDYALGVHFKPSATSSLFWSHIHFTLTVGEKVALEGNQLNSLRHYFFEAFDHATGLDVPPIVNSCNLGRLGTTVISENKRKKQRKGKVVTASYLENLFAYTFRNDEEDDTPAVASARHLFLTDLGYPQTMTRSRRRLKPGSEELGASSPSRTRAPSSFDPLRLSKGYIYKFPLDGGAAIRVAPENYEEELERMNKDALGIAEKAIIQHRKNHEFVAELTK